MLRTNKSIIESDFSDIPTLPSDFHTKLSDLELKLERGSLTHESLKELFECYSIASGYYEATDKTEDFKLYIKKMQDLLKNEKIQPLLKRRNSRELMEKLESTVEQKREKIEKIKNLIKDTNTNKNVKEATNNLIESFNKKENSNNDLMNRDIAGQEENFKKRLEEKKLFRTSSQPHMGFKSNKLKKKIDKDTVNQVIADEVKNNFNEAEKSDPIQLGFRKKSSITISQSPVKRRSRIEKHEEELSSLHALKNNLDHNNLLRNLNLDSNVNRKQSAISSSGLNSKENLDTEFNEMIINDLNEIWDKAEKKMLEELEKIQNDIEKLMEDLMEEKLAKTLEINQKYENELKELETDLDLNDETNINTIIYNDIKKDRENEKQEFYAELEIRKKNGIAELKHKSLNVINVYKNGEEILKIKENIVKNIKDKIIKSLGSKENLKAQNKVSVEYNEENDGFEDEILDDVKENDITPAKGLKKYATEKNAFRKPVNLSKRVSRGYLGNVDLKEYASENVKEN